MSSTTNEAEQITKSCDMKGASIAADLQRHQSSATFVTSALALVLRPRLTQRAIEVSGYLPGLNRYSARNDRASGVIVWLRCRWL